MNLIQTIQMLNYRNNADLKKEIKKDLKKEILKDAQNENLKLKLDAQNENLKLKLDAQKEAKNKDTLQLPQRDNSKATSQKDDKPINSKSKDTLKETFNVHLNKDTILKESINPTDELADLFIGTITNNAKMADFRNSNSSGASNSKQSNSTGNGVFDDLRIKIIEQVHLKAKIFFSALTNNQLLRESALKNKNDGLNKFVNSIYSSTPFLKPYQANVRPVATNSNGWCSSLSSSFTQYSQLNAFLVAAFLLFPVVIPFYLFGWLTLFLLRAMFCIGAKNYLSQVIYRIRSS